MPGCQPPLVNRRSSVNRLVNRQPVDAGEQYASDCAIRQAVFDFRALCRKVEILRMFAKFVRLKGTGESQFRPAAADLCSILSVENRAGALRAIACQNCVRLEIAFFSTQTPQARGGEMSCEQRSALVACGKRHPMMAHASFEITPFPWFRRGLPAELQHCTVTNSQYSTRQRGQSARGFRTFAAN